jgi:autotransporter-associated beta strand protein
VITDNSPGTLTLSGPASTITTLNINGGAGSILDIGAGSLTFVNAGASFMQSTTGGTINATGGGTIVLGSTNPVPITNFGDNGTVAGTTLTVNANISGGFGFEIWGGSITAGTVVLTAANTFTGDVNIDGGILSVSNIGNTGSVTSNLGAGTNLYIAGGGTNALKYTGAGETTNRVINLDGTTTGGIIDQSGPTGNLKFTANLAIPGAGAKTLTLQGSTAGTGEIAGIIVDNSATNNTGVTKLGTGIWTLSGVNTYTGKTTIDQGTLAITANQTLGSLTFGAANAGTNVGALDLTNANLTFTSLLVQTNSATANNITLGGGKTLTITGGATVGSTTIGNTTALNVTGGSLSIGGGLNAGVVATGGTTTALTLTNTNLSVSGGAVNIGSTTAAGDVASAVTVTGGSATFALGTNAMVIGQHASGGTAATGNGLFA